MTMEQRVELAHGAPEIANRPLHVGQPNLGPRAELDALLDGIYERSWLTNDGPLVRQLEGAIASRLGVRHCVAMSNGTVALEIAIRALGLTGEVIVPSFTFVATAHALHWQGVTPVFADIDPTTHNLDPASVESQVSERTTGIIGVHLWGRPAPVVELQDIADRHGLALIFDAAHAFDCTLAGRKIGGFGRAEVFSFHATKFFNTFEGGAILTDDAELAERARLMRNFGFFGYDNVVYPGTNGKLSEVHAAMGLVNLRHLDEVVAQNRRAHAMYTRLLSDLVGISVLQPLSEEEHNYQYVVVEVSGGAVRRDAILAPLLSRGILARKYFWPGVHNMEPYRTLFPEAGSRLPNTVRIADSVLVLPTGPSISDADIRGVVGVIREAG